MDQSSSASARRRASGESSGDAAKTRSMSQPLGNNSPSPGPTGVAVQRSYSGATPGRSAFTTVPPASAVAVPPKQPESQPTSARSLPPSSSAYQQQNPFSPKDAGTEGAAPPAEEEPTDYSSDEDGMLFQKRPPSRQKVRREPAHPKTVASFHKEILRSHHRTPCISTCRQDILSARLPPRIIRTPVALELASDH